jgi:hypothetical protein
MNLRPIHALVYMIKCYLYSIISGHLCLIGIVTVILLRPVMRSFTLFLTPDTLTLAHLC